MTQAAGRSGRKNRQGVVIIQSADPGQEVYSFVTRNNYDAFFRRQLAERKMFNYPPFCRLIRVVLKHKEERKVEAAAALLAEILRKTMKERLLGPNKPIVGRIQLFHIRELLLKLENGLSPQKVRDTLKNGEEVLRHNPQLKYVTLYYDVDPL
jgi:primosomal protein N' (replication factor Y)